MRRNTRSIGNNRETARRPAALFLTLVILAAGSAWLHFRAPIAPPFRAEAQSNAPMEESLRQFRIVFGINDTEPREWTGRVTASGGELSSLAGWRFSQGDRAASNDGTFRFRTKIGNYENQLNSGTPYGQTDWNAPEIRRHIPEGLVVRTRGPALSMRIRVAVEGAPPIEFAAAAPTYAAPVSLLDGNVRVERLPAELRLSEEGMQDDAPALTIAPDGTAWTAWLAYQDQGDYVVVGDALTSTRITEKGDHHSPAITALPNGWLLAAWSQREGAEFHIYTSFRVAGRWTPGRRMTLLAGSHIWPVLSADADGRVTLAWQSLREGRSAIRMRVFDGRNWSVEEPVNQDGGNAWAPVALALAGKRTLLAWDSYSTGAYQIWFRDWPNAPERVTVGERFSVRPSLAATPDGKAIVAAWEESDALWGKDFAFLTDRRGTPLYKNRRIRLAVRGARGVWGALSGDPAESLPESIRRYMQQPRIAFDAAGRLHLVFRCRTFAGTARIDNWAAAGRWETFLTRREGDRWTPAILMPSSEGRNGMRAALAIDRDQLVVAWPTDRRSFPQNAYGDLDVYSARLAAVGAPSTLTTEAWREEPAAAPPHLAESADVERIRAHRVELNGKSYRIVRGDLHRHTELSQDGAGDGSLDDLYRYALDAAQMDYAHVADHQMGSDEEYNWWLTQKSNDVYFMPQRFVPLYGYERSVPYPNGHRNVIWATRGRPVLKIGEKEAKGVENSGAVVYPYLRRTDGIVTSHTSATQQGTDWRDHDPDLEPIVEIYQGFESSYEHEGAPRAWKPGEKAVHQGVRPAGYVWNAWAKGHKLGVQASSDHVSTHTSFACILVEELTRQGLVDAMRKRHTYAATDSIVLDYRLATSAGVALMGDAVESRTPPRLEIRIIGTSPVAEVEIVKNNVYIHKAAPGTREVSLSYVDAAFGEGESYYYVRARQSDGQLVWSSPIWVRKMP